MAKSLSEDLRCRLISAVAGGMSRRAAAERFGVSAASGVRWVHTWRETGGDLGQRQIDLLLNRTKNDPAIGFDALGAAITALALGSRARGSRPIRPPMAARPRTPST